MTKTRFGLILLGVLACGFYVGCGSDTPAPTAPPVSNVRDYQATASVGDFITITVDADSQTIDYTNVTNGETGTVSYTVGVDGAYEITTPGSHMIKAYEIPGLALVADMDNTGPTQNTTSLVTAILKAPITQATLQNKNFNYMQWRTNSGGMETGSVAIDGTGNVVHRGYWPYGDLMAAMNQGGGGGGSGSPFNGGTFDASLFTPDPTGTYLTLTESGSGGTDTIFGTEGGCFVVDMANGSMVGVPQAASTAFDTAFAGTYRALAFNKPDATTGNNNLETGTGRVDSYTLTLTAGGGLTVVDGNGATAVSTTIVPVADAAYLQGAGQLGDPCPGLFTYRVLPAGGNTMRQDVFLSFLDGGAILFCSFSYDTAQASGSMQYSYFYGVALKQ